MAGDLVSDRADGRSVAHGGTSRDNSRVCSRPSRNVLHSGIGPRRSSLKMRLATPRSRGRPPAWHTSHQYTGARRIAHNGNSHQTLQRRPGIGRPRLRPLLDDQRTKNALELRAATSRRQPGNTECGGILKSTGVSEGKAEKLSYQRALNWLSAKGPPKSAEPPLHGTDGLKRGLERPGGDPPLPLPH